MSAAATIVLDSLELTRFFVAILMLLAASQLLGYVFHGLKMPRVVGEIIGGLLLGPTVLGYLSPPSYDWVFNAFQSEGKLISAVSWLGLVLLMFVSGFEIERSFRREDRRLAIAIFVGATLIPFLAGVGLAGLYDFSKYTGPNGNIVSLTIVVGVAVAVTSIPVISRILMDLRVLDTRFATVVLAVATVEDIILFAALAVATSISGASVQISNVAYAIVVPALFFGLALLILPKLLGRLANSRLAVVVRSFPTRFALFLCFGLAATASLLNVNVVFGAFLAGITLGTMPQSIFRNARSHVKSVALGFFTPVYFAVVGLKLDLIRQFDPLLLLGFLAFSTLLKTTGTLAAGKLFRKSWLSSINLAVALNARGGPGIVLATVAFDLGIITESFFVALVLVAIVTSLFAGYWLRYIVSKGLPLMDSEPEEMPMAEETPLGRTRGQPPTLEAC